VSRGIGGRGETARVSTSPTPKPPIVGALCPFPYPILPRNPQLLAAHLPRAGVGAAQLIQLGALCTFLFVLTAIASDAVPLVSCVRLPPPELEGLAALPALSHMYQYVVLKLGPITVTRRSVALAANTATLSFSMLQVRGSGFGRGFLSRWRTRLTR
jgi:hypothetical protein